MEGWGELAGCGGNTAVLVGTCVGSSNDVSPTGKAAGGFAATSAKGRAGCANGRSVCDAMSTSQNRSVRQCGQCGADPGGRTLSARSSF